MGKKPAIAVLGAGSGGACMTADLIENGFKVNLYELPQFQDSMQPFVERGGIEITGKIEGFYEPNAMTTDMEEALEGVDIATMNVRAFAHDLFVEKALPHLKKGLKYVSAADKKHLPLIYLSSRTSRSSSAVIRAY